MSDFNEDEFEDLDDVFDTIVMTGDDGEEIEFIVIDSVEMEGDIYLLLVQDDEIDDEEAEAYIFKEVSSDGDEAVFEEPSEEEFNKVSEMFKSLTDDFDIDEE